MRYLFLIILSILLLVSCTPVKTPRMRYYMLRGDVKKQVKTSAKTRFTLLVSRPQASAGYQTKSMIYVKKAYGLGQFAKHAWVAPPASMLTPLLVRSIQNAHYFYAVASSPYVGKTDFRLDTTLLALQQNFLYNPSQLVFIVQATLTNAVQNRLLKSHHFVVRINAPENTPYGGVIAANRAVNEIVRQIAAFTTKYAKITRLPTPTSRR